MRALHNPWPLFALIFGASGVVFGVGHPVKSLADVRRADARSAQIGCRCGIAQFFQVSEYSGEPCTSKATRNLLAKDNWRAALLDEASELGEEVPTVEKSALTACCRERLTRATACPDRATLGPSGESKGEWPASDAREKVALGVSVEIGGVNVCDGSVIDVSLRQLPLFDQLA